MRFLNELIRKTKAAHIDELPLNDAGESGPYILGDGGGAIAEPELPHLRRAPNFDQFAANRPSNTEEDVAKDIESWNAPDEDSIPADAAEESLPTQTGEEAETEFTAEQPDAEVEFVHQDVQNEINGSNGSDVEALLGDDDELIVRREEQLEAETADEAAPEDLVFDEEPIEPEELAEAPAEPAEEEPSVDVAHAPETFLADSETPETPPAEVSEPVETPTPSRPETVTRVNIWDIEGAGEEDEDFADAFAEAASFAEAEVTPIVPEAPTQQRRGGRVRTRLLGFQRPEELAADPFARSTNNVAANAEPTFPVGWMVVEKGPGRGAFFPLFNGVSKIGRGEDQTVRLDFGDMSVSRDSHAVVAYDDEQRSFFVGHSGKSNPVRLNGMPVLSTEPFKDGDKIRIGETTLRFVALCGPDFDWDEETDSGERNVASR